MIRTGRSFHRSIRSFSPLLSRSSSSSISCYRSVPTPTNHRLSNVTRISSPSSLSSFSSSSSSSLSSSLLRFSSLSSPLCSSSLSPPSCGTDDEGRIGAPHRSLHYLSFNKLSSVLTDTSSSPSSSSSSSTDDYSDVLDPSNPPILPLSYYHLLLNRLSEKTKQNHPIETSPDPDDDTVIAARMDAEEEALDKELDEEEKREREAILREKEGIEEEEKEYHPSEEERTLMERLEKFSDRELEQLLKAEEVMDEEIDPVSEKEIKKTSATEEKNPLPSIIDSPLFNDLSQELGLNQDHLKQLAAYALLMRRKIADGLGLIPSDVERISDSGRLSQHLLRIVENELTPNHPRFSGLISDQDIDVTSLGTLGSTATMARLSAVSEWQSSYHPRKLTSRSNRMKYCKICIGEANRDPRYNVTYTNVELLHSFINERGKIIGRRHTRVCAKHQRGLQKEIKRARNMALLGWLSDWKVPNSFVQEFYGDQSELKRMSEEIEFEKDEEEKERIRYRRSIGISDKKNKSQREHLDPNIAMEYSDAKKLRILRGHTDPNAANALTEEEQEDRMASQRRSVFTREQKLIGRRREQTIEESFVAEELEEKLQRMNELYNDKVAAGELRKSKSVYRPLSDEEKDELMVGDAGDIDTGSEVKSLGSFRKQHTLDPAEAAQQANQAKNKRKQK